MIFREPPIRRLFIPRPGFVMFEADLKRADAQVVAKESNDEDLLQDFRNNIDIYTANAKWLYEADNVTSDQRQWNKNGVHAVDYYCQARTLATTLHTTVAKAEEYIERWFRLHPGIRDWHRRVSRTLRDSRTVCNCYGFQRYYTDRFSPNLIAQALAWIASSTVSVTINRGLLRIYHELPRSEIFLQIHDSVLGQVRKESAVELLPLIQKKMQVEIPGPGEKWSYRSARGIEWCTTPSTGAKWKEPLVIPISLKVSDKSWGDVKEWTSQTLSS